MKFKRGHLARLERAETRTTELSRELNAVVGQVRMLGADICRREGHTRGMTYDLPALRWVHCGRCQEAVDPVTLKTASLNEDMPIPGPTI